MLRTRVLMGAVLIALVVGMLVFDQHFSPWFPFLFVFTMVLAVGGTLELVWLIDPARRPPLWLCVAGVVGVLLANWPAHLWLKTEHAWPLIAGAFAAVVVAAFLAEMAV